MKAHLPGFLKRHRKAEEAAAEAVGLDLLWSCLRWAGVIGASSALAATATVLTRTSAYHPQFSLSAQGAALITRFEGVRYTPYNDPWNCTTGVGHLIHMGRCTSSDYTRWKLTPAQSTALLLHDATRYEQYVRSSVTRPINQPQFDALVSFTFNVGPGGLQRSSVLRDVNAGDTADITRAFTVWSYANGVRLQGLYTRRLAEAHLYLTGDYGPGLGRYQPPKPERPRYFYSGSPASMRKRAAK